MGLIESIKPFWPLILTFIIPRALGYYHALKAAVRTRPPPRQLPSNTSRGLNILFGVIIGFLISSFPIMRSKIEDQNVFVVTKSRFLTPNDSLFGILARLRRGGILTARDEALKTKLTTPILRNLYLRFGPSTMIDCQFCQPEDDLSYLLYHLPTNILLPHLFHIFVLGVVTSEFVSGFEASQWRRKSILCALSLLVLDVYQTWTNPFFPSSLIGPSSNPFAPSGSFWLIKTIRSLTFCVFDLILASIIYSTSTGRFPILLFLLNKSHPDLDPLSVSDPDAVRKKNEQALTQMNVAMQLAHTKLRAFTVARNAVVRNKKLKDADDGYWRTVVAMEGPLAGGNDDNGETPQNGQGAGQSVWDDEEVQAAMARVYGSGSIDVARMRREADAFVDGITRGLDSSS